MASLKLLALLAGGDPQNGVGGHHPIGPVSTGTIPRYAQGVFGPIKTKDNYSYPCQYSDDPFNRSNILLH